ncbi:MAG: M23 family metallopeptidase [Xanthomonadales bacterium]|nr:M23 family metallopeptidase [Xanthomonadales bacterium]
MRGIPAGGRRAAITVLATLACTLAQAADPTITVQFAPAPLPTVKGPVLVYELNVHNFDSAECARLAGVAMAGGVEAAALAGHWSGSALAGNALVYSGAMKPVATPPEGPVDIPAGGGAILYFHVPLANAVPAPSALRHELAFESCDGVAGQARQVEVEIPVSAEPPVVVGLPFEGAGWVAGDAVNDRGVHRRTAIPVEGAGGQPLLGRFHVPERYAIDWVMTDDQARRAIGPVDRNESYLAFGQEILAAADGVIVAVRDGFPNHTPPYNPPGQTTQTAAGNYIMQDIGGGRFAFYAHLVPGSLRVAVGDEVRRGEVIALLGNSGNTSEPHLHFHVSDGPDPLMSEGVPFVFDHFAAAGHADGMNEESGRFDDWQAHHPLPTRGLMPASFQTIDTHGARSLHPRPLPPLPIRAPGG